MIDYDELLAIRDRILQTDQQYGYKHQTQTERDRRALYLYVMKLKGWPDAHGLDWHSRQFEYVETNVKEP